MRPVHSQGMCSAVSPPLPAAPSPLVPPAPPDAPPPDVAPPDAAPPDAAPAAPPRPAEPTGPEPACPPGSESLVQPGRASRPPAKSAATEQRRCGKERKKWSEVDIVGRTIAKPSGASNCKSGSDLKDPVCQPP